MAIFLHHANKRIRSTHLSGRSGNNAYLQFSKVEVSGEQVLNKINF